MKSSAQYVAAGGLNATYNFGTRVGSFAVNNYDGRSLALTGTPTTSGASYKIGITSVPGIAGSFSGSFYGPVAANTGGNFNFHTIFAAKR